MADLSTIDEAVAAVGDRSGRTLLVARGRVRAHPPRALEHVLDITDGAPQLLFRGWLVLEDRDLLLQALSAPLVRKGGLEPKRFWWTSDAAVFCFWDTQGLLWQQHEDGVKRLRPDAHWSSDQIESVEAYVGEDWVEQGVRLQLKNGAVVSVALHLNTSVRDDLEYDGFTLDHDTSWCRQVARALAEALHIPYVNKT